MIGVRTERGPIAALVLGSSGRVGRAVVADFDADVNVTTIGRYSHAGHDVFDTELGDALGAVDVVLNLAGVAHLDGEPSAADLDRLTAANVTMPLLLARRCIEHTVPLIHVSSSKSDAATTPYGWSKALCDATLETTFGPRFASSNIPLVILKPPALLIGPFDAGKLARVRWIDRVPKRLLPPLTMPVLSQERFVGTLADRLERCLTPARNTSLEPGVHIVRWNGDELDGLHAIHAAMRNTRKNRHR